MLRLPIFVTILIITSAVSSYADDVQIPAACVDKSYCTEKPKNYDTEIRHVKNLHTYKNDKKDKAVQPTVPDIVNPDGNNCGYIRHVKKPFIVRARKNVTSPITHKYLVQTIDFVQTLLATECLDEGANCFEDVVDMEGGLIATCTTKSTWIRMAVLENGEITYQEVDQPISCSCFVRFEEELGTR